MPYIKDEDRQRILAGGNPQTPGELNFLFTTISLKYIEEHGENYQHWNDIQGALTGASMELARRWISKYEDGAIERNGDL